MVVPKGFFMSASAARLAGVCESSCPIPTEEMPNTQQVIVQHSVVYTGNTDTFVVSKHNKDDCQQYIPNKHRVTVHTD